ncbi:GEVED domain-containing protein [Saprospiraceae bacterium]|nr:GEVED domain-containing protein [Saprospiraceae bacterium]
MRYFTLFSFLLVSYFSQAQTNSADYKWMMDDYSINFYDVVASADAYFMTIDITKKGSGYKPFQRWKEANEYKYYPSGDRSQTDPYFVHKKYEGFVNKNPQNNKSLFTDWNDLGPYTIDSITGHYAAGLGRVEDIYVDPSNPDIIYQGSRSGGFWATNDGGVNWTGSTDFLPGSGVNAIAVSPTNSDSILINVRHARNGTSYGLYRSTDGGVSWNESNFNPTNLGFGGLGTSFQIYRVFYSPLNPNRIVVGTNEGVYVSDDNLATWNRELTTSDVSQLAFHPTNPDIIYCYDSYYWNNANHNSLFRTLDGGVTWTLSNSMPNNNGNRSMRISTSVDCPDCVYTGSSTGVWRSINNGLDFTFLTNPAQGCGGFAVSDLDTSNIIYGYVDLEASTDGGASFSQVTFWSLGNTNGAGSGHQNSYQNSTNYVHADMDIAKCVNGVFYVGTDGFVSKSTDNGTTWINIGEGVGIRENYCLGVSQSNHYRTICGSQDNGTSIYTENDWVEFYGADGMEGFIHPLNDDWMTMSTQYAGRRKTTNGGLSSTGANPSGASSGYWIAPFAYDPNDHMSIYDFRDSIYRSDDFGNSYVYLSSPIFSGTVKVAEIAQNNSQIVIAINGQDINKSTDGAVTWTDIKNTLPNYSITDVAFDPLDDNTFIVTYARYQDDGQKVFITTDGGATWNNITYNLNNMPIRSVVIDHSNESNIYLGAEKGVYTMPMGETSWQLYNTALPNVSVSEMEIMWGTNTLRGATWGRGLWEYSLIGRKDHPAILSTEITNPPTLDSPKATTDQFITSTVSYDGTLSSVFVKWSLNDQSYNNLILMTNSSDSTWVSTTPIAENSTDQNIYFKVFAVGANQDTTESYKFMYKVAEFDYCDATGHANNGNLYLNDITIAEYNKTSNNDLYSLVSDTLIEMEVNKTYAISTKANTSWSQNDHAAWIDFNKDAFFTVDERILYAPNAGLNGNASFTVPIDAVVDDTLRLRIRLGYWGDTPDACGNTLGEVEDYLIRIKNPDCNIVINTFDTGVGSLRDAVNCASTGDTIFFDSSLNGATIELNSASITLGKNLTFYALQSDNITISSVIPQIASLETLFEVEPSQTIKFQGLTLQGAYGIEGSVFRNSGRLTLEEMNVLNGGKMDVTSTVKNESTGQLTLLGTTNID